MSNVNGIGGGAPINRAQALKAFGATKPAGPIDRPTTGRASDRVELSGLDHIMAKLKTNDVRTDKVQAIRQQIAEGTYETPEKLDGAIDKLLDEIG
ncbi:MAG: flagellar biosynthesis anti-sigma factor FlgM [Tepidisphaeraceae bacterium]